MLRFAELKSFEHGELRSFIGSRFLIFGSRSIARHQVLGLESLELHIVHPRIGSSIDETMSNVHITIVIYSGFGNDYGSVHSGFT